MIKPNKVIMILCCVLALVKHGHQSSADQNFKDERNQTEEQIDAKELLKSFLLKKLDLDSVPSNFGDTKVPKFMLDIFETNSLSKKDRIYSFPHDSNTIRSHPMVKKDKKCNLKRNKSGFLIKFNVTIPMKETLNAGELRLYLNRSNKCASKKQRITINQIIQQDQQMSNKTEINQYTTIQDENGLVYRQIDTLVVKYDRHVDKPIWMQFDIYPAVESWLKNSSLNYGLLIKSYCVDRNEFIINEDKFVDNFVLQATIYDGQNDFEDEFYESFKPILLTYSNFKVSTDYSEDNFDLFMAKKKRDINPDAIASIRNNYENDESNWKNGKTKGCTKYPMYVDFYEIGWKNFIIAPKGFNAYLCYGQCSLNAIVNSNTSNHATMQSLSNGIQPLIVPPPCCVPTAYSSIAIMYNEGNTPILKVYDNMIVKKCNCL